MREIFKRLYKHIHRWNKWRKYNINSWVHKLLVLIKCRESPTFNAVLTDDEEKEIQDAFMRGYTESIRRQVYEKLGIEKPVYSSNSSVVIFSKGETKK